MPATTHTGGAVDRSNWCRIPMAGDCPECGEDSVSRRLAGDGVHEVRRCADGHEFTAEATVYAPMSEATIFDEGQV